MTTTLPISASDAFEWLWSNRGWFGGVAGVVIAGSAHRLFCDRRRTIFRQSNEEGQADFREFRTQTWEQGKAVGEAGKGEVRVLKKGIIDIDRLNVDGRVGLRFMGFRFGKNLFDHIPEQRDADSQRFFVIKLEARARNGTHNLRLALRTHPNEEFIQDTYLSVQSGDWQKFGRILAAPSDKNLRFFVESAAQKSLGSVQIRKLVVAEKSGDLCSDLLSGLLKRAAHEKNND